SRARVGLAFAREEPPLGGLRGSGGTGRSAGRDSRVGSGAGQWGGFSEQERRLVEVAGVDCVRWRRAAEVLTFGRGLTGRPSWTSRAPVGGGGAEVRGWG